MCTSRSSLVEELGLTQEESQRLFAGENDAGAVRRIAESDRWRTPLKHPFYGLFVVY